MGRSAPLGAGPMIVLEIDPGAGSGPAAVDSATMKLLAGHRTPVIKVRKNGIVSVSALTARIEGIGIERAVVE